MLIKSYGLIKDKVATDFNKAYKAYFKNFKLVLFLFLHRSTRA